MRHPSSASAAEPSKLRDLVLAAGADGGAPGDLARGTAAPLSSRLVALRVRPANDARTTGVLPESWLLAEWPTGNDEPIKYWLSNLSADTRLARLVALAKLRPRIEYDYRELKQCLGLDHCEGRTRRALHHHLMCVTVADGFLTVCRLARAGAPAARLRRRQPDNSLPSPARPPAHAGLLARLQPRMPGAGRRPDDLAKSY